MTDALEERSDYIREKEAELDRVDQKVFRARDAMSRMEADWELYVNSKEAKKKDGLTNNSLREAWVQKQKLEDPDYLEAKQRYIDAKAERNALDREIKHLERTYQARLTHERKKVADTLKAANLNALA